ncbi:MAG: stress-induced protein [Candidatus Zambryskibacteria bacterium]|nr:stress-induced protein [Candidatus Zambryskibacteria bacterium]
MAKEDRGFASMSSEKVRESASKGGRAAHAKGGAHEWTAKEARDAGRKGGLASHARRRERLAQAQEGAPTSTTESKWGGGEGNLH